MRSLFFSLAGTLAILAAVSAPGAGAALRGVAHPAYAPHAAYYAGRAISLTAFTNRPDKKGCPKKYYICVTVGPGSGENAQVLLCYGACSSGTPYYWYETTTTARGKPTHKIDSYYCSYTPSPPCGNGIVGNPVYLYVFDNGAKPRHRFEIYTQACSSPSMTNCSAGYIGVRVLPS